MRKIIPLLTISLSLMLFSIMLNPVSADVIPPKKQSNLGIPVEDIVCETGMFKVIRTGSNTVACVKPETASKLVSKGWAQKFDESKLNEFVTKISISSGKINPLVISPITTDFGKLSPKVSVASYDYVFEVCASSKSLVSPEILVRSDSETKHYELSETISANSCVVSGTIIKAANQDSISAIIVSKGDVSEIILTASDRVSSLRQQILEAKQSFGKENTEANKKQGNMIADLRLQLNDAVADLHRMYFLLYTPAKSNLKVEKMSFSGIPIQGEKATKISVSESIATPNTYDVVFEACAGDKQVRIPVIMITSDMQNVNVKLGDKIAPNTCQLTSAKIGATDPQTILVKVAGNAESSDKASGLEAKINDLQNQLISEKDSLKNLVHEPKRPNDFNEQLTAKVEKITLLRNEIISLKAELSKILYQTYQ